MLSGKKTKDKVVITKQQEQEHQLVLQGRLFPHPNHKVFEVEVVNGETLVREPEFKLDTTYKFNPHYKKGDPIAKKSEVIIKQGCYYVVAMNKETALNKFKKGLNGSKF